MTRGIVVAPAGSRFSADVGSEDGWIYDIVTGVAAVEPDFRFTCITEQTDGAVPDGVHAVGIGRRRTEELGGLLLPLRMARAATAASRIDEVDLVHHALPFTVGRSFSLLTAQAHRRGVPVVIGPVQTPLEWTGPDEVGGQLAAGGQRPLRRAATAMAGAVWPVAKPAFALLSVRTLCRADRVVVISQPARLLVESAGVDPRRVEIIPPPTRVLPSTPSQRTRRSGPIRLVTAGYLIERKAVHDIVTVVADLAAAGEAVVLDVAGDGPAAARLRELARGHRAGTAIRFHGWLERSKLAELLRSADGYVSMSRAESWGQVVADALASALVVVSAANTGARSMTEMGAPVRLVPLGDRQYLAEELRRLCRTDRNLLDEEGAAGVRWAAEHIAAPVVAERWAAVYRQAIERAGRHTALAADEGGVRWGKAEGAGMSGPTPRFETSEPVHQHLLRSVQDEALSVHRAFGNWLPLLAAIALGRAQGRPPALRMSVRHGGPTIHTPGGDRSWWTAVECFGRDCYRLSTADLPPAPAVVDIGANIGGFALAVLAVRPQAQVAAYEPSPAALAALRTNIAVNNAQARVAVHHGAVTGPSEPDTVWLNEQVGNLCTSSVLDQGDAVGVSAHRVEVPAVPLSAILSSYAGDIDLLKMDVEGAEYGIVEATSVELLAKVRRMVVEYHDVPGRNVRELAHHLHTAGLVWERQEHSALPGQGLAWWARPAEDR